MRKRSIFKSGQIPAQQNPAQEYLDFFQSGLSSNANLPPRIKIPEYAWEHFKESPFLLQGRILNALGDIEELGQHIEASPPPRFFGLLNYNYWPILLHTRNLFYTYWPYWSVYDRMNNLVNGAEFNAYMQHLSDINSELRGAGIPLEAGNAWWRRAAGSIGNFLKFQTARFTSPLGYRALLEHAIRSRGLYPDDPRFGFLLSKTTPHPRTTIELYSSAGDLLALGGAFVPYTAPISVPYLYGMAIAWGIDSTFNALSRLNPGFNKQLLFRSDMIEKAGDVGFYQGRLAPFFYSTVPVDIWVSQPLLLARLFQPLDERYADPDKRRDLRDTIRGLTRTTVKMKEMQTEAKLLMAQTLANELAKDQTYLDAIKRDADYRQYASQITTEIVNNPILILSDSASRLQFLNNHPVYSKLPQNLKDKILSLMSDTVEAIDRRLKDRNAFIIGNGREFRDLAQDRNRQPNDRSLVTLYYNLVRLNRWSPYDQIMIGRVFGNNFNMNQALENIQSLLFYQSKLGKFMVDYYAKYAPVGLKEEHQKALMDYYSGFSSGLFFAMEDVRKKLNQKSPSIIGKYVPTSIDLFQLLLGLPAPNIIGFPEHVQVGLRFTD